MHGISKEPFGTLPNGKKVTLYTLRRKGITVKLIDLGATVVDIVLDRPDGTALSVVRGYDDLSSYLNADGYLGAVVGRIGNRIANGHFSLDGKKYTLYQNDGKNHLHGGKCGFDKRLWKVDEAPDGEPSLTFSLLSPDMDEGYPGDLIASVRYSLTERGGLRLDYTAACDAPTPLNLTNHTYFNLNGTGDILSHGISMKADSYLPTDKGLIPTGELRSVDGTPFDLRARTTVSHGFAAPNDDITLAGGYDHCMIFTSTGDPEHDARVSLVGDKSGIEMKLYTDRPGVQFYSGNFLGNPRYPFRGGETQKKHAALCLETEALPDAVNQPQLNAVCDTVLRPGNIYRSFTEYVFS